MSRFDLPARAPKGGIRRERGLLGWVLGTVLLASACGQAGVVEPEAPAQTSRLLSATARKLPPEVLRARVELLGLPIATLESSSCAAPGGGLTVETEVEAAPLVRVVRRTSGEARTELTRASGAPRSSNYTFRDGDLIRNYEVDYRAGSFSYVYDNGGVARRTGTDAVPEGAEPHDLHSAMLQLRAWRPRLDETAYLYVILGRRPWRVDLTSRGPEMITLGRDARLTYRIDGVAVRLWEPESAKPKRFSIWLSEDADRVPLRMVADATFGQVTMTLTGRDTGAAACSPAVAREDR